MFISSSVTSSTVSIRFHSVTLFRAERAETSSYGDKTLETFSC